MRLRITYVSSAGTETKREIEPRTWGTVGIRATCLLRGEVRSFCYNRIRSCVDMDTGEVIDDVESYLKDSS